MDTPIEVIKKECITFFPNCSATKIFLLLNSQKRKSKVYWRMLRRKNTISLKAEYIWNCWLSYRIWSSWHPISTLPRSLKSYSLKLNLEKIRLLRPLIGLFLILIARFITKHIYRRSSCCKAYPRQKFNIFLAPILGRIPSAI